MFVKLISIFERVTLLSIIGNLLYFYYEYVQPPQIDNLWARNLFHTCPYLPEAYMVYRS